MNKREQSPIYQTRSTRVLDLDDVRRAGRARRLALAAAGLIALVALAALIGQGLRAAAEPSGAPAAGARPDSARERVLGALAEATRPAAPTAAPPAAPTATPGGLTVSGTGIDGLRLRAAPGLAGELVAVLPEGSAVRPTGRQAFADGLAWAEVAADGASGWAAAEYLR